MSTTTIKLRELLHSDDSGEWGEAATEVNSLLILRAGNIADETWLDLDDVVYRAIAEPKRSRLLLRAGDILLERSGGTDTRPVGRVAYVDRDIEAGFSNFLHRLRVNREIADPSYLRFVLAHWHRSGRAVALQTQTTGIRNLMFSRYLDEPIRLPALSIQRKVAAILEAATESLARTDALIAAKREQKRGLMQQLLTGKVRFPGFTEPWKTVRLEQIASLRNAKTIPGNASSVRCIELEHIEQGTGEILGSAPAGSTVSLKTAFQPGDVLFGKLRPYLRKFALVDFSGFCSTEIWALAADQSAVTPDYLRLLVESSPIQRSANATSGTKMPRADWDVVAATSVHLPPIAEQDRVTALVRAIETELRLLRRQRAAITKQRRGLMERLLSGDLVIPSSETTAA